MTVSAHKGATRLNYRATTSDVYPWRPSQQRLNGFGPACSPIGGLFAVGFSLPLPELHSELLRKSGAFMQVCACPASVSV